MDRSTARIPFSLLAALVWVYVIVRATTVPFTDDEAHAWYWYAERGVFLPPAAHWDSGNHFFASALGVLSHKLWGFTLWGPRLVAVLLFPLYAWALFRIGGALNDRRLRWLLWLALLTCPFLLDFFSLFRGFGPAMAFALIALDGGLRYRERASRHHLAQSLVGLALATSAMLSLLPLHAVALVAVLVTIRRQAREGSLPAPPPAIPLVLWTVLGLLPLLGGTWLALAFHGRGLLGVPEAESLVRTTLLPLSGLVLGSTRVLVPLLALALVLAATLLVVQRGQWRTPLALLAGLLWADVAARVIMRYTLGVPYPEDRHALHWVPLAVLLVAFAADDLPARVTWMRRVVLVALLFFPLRALYTANITHTLRWPGQAVPERFLGVIARKNARADRPLNIGTNSGLGMALPHAARRYGLNLNPPDTYGFPEGPHDMRIVERRDLPAARQDFDVVDSAAAQGIYLLMPRPSLRTAIFDRYHIPAASSSETYIPIWRDDTLAVVGDILVDLWGKLVSEAHYLDLALVAEVEMDGQLAYYRHMGLPMLRPRWQGEALHLLIRVPAIPGATARAVYLHNPANSAVDVGRMEVKLHRILTVMPH